MQIGQLILILLLPKVELKLNDMISPPFIIYFDLAGPILKL
nr:MAG TPA: hypothetical protein [Caudoviricetes sp.]